MAKKEELKPKIEEVKLNPEMEKNLKELSESFLKNEDKNIQVVNSGTQQIDSFFNNIINNLYSDEDIDMKTQYDDNDSVFASSKGEFLSKYTNIPTIHGFLKTFERKMVSHSRKGRTEILLGLQRRNEEENARAFREMPYRPMP